MRQPTHQLQFARVTKIAVTYDRNGRASETRLVVVSGVDFDSAFKPEWGISFSPCRIRAL